MFDRIVLVCCLLISTIASGQDAALAEEQCFKLASHAEARACLEARSQQSALAVQQAESSLRAAFLKWDQEPQYRARSIAALNDSSAKFRQYRESQCEFQAAVAAGGNGAGDRRLLCNIGLNLRRTAELQAIQASLQ